MRDPCIGPRGGPAGSTARPCPTGRPTRWASAAPHVKGCWERGPPAPPPRHHRRQHRVPKAPPVVNLSVGGSHSGSAPLGRERNYTRSRAHSAGTGGGSRTSSVHARYRSRAASARWEGAPEVADDNRSVCTTASLLSHARSDSAALNVNPPTRSPPWSTSQVRDHSRVLIGKDGPGGGGGASYPKGYAKVQEMVKRLRDSRTPATDIQQTHRSSGLCQLSIQGRKDTIDPVLAWSNLTQSERGWSCLDPHPHHQYDPCGGSTAGTEGEASRPDLTLATTTSVSADALSLSDDEGIVSGGDEEEEGTMENMSIPPFTTSNNTNNDNLEEDEEIFRYSSSNYHRRTGQIINYYVEKEGAPSEQDGPYDRHDGCYNKGSRSVPSQASLYRPAPSSSTYPRHWRSSTVPPPPRRATFGGVGGGDSSGGRDRSSVSGRVFMGKRIHPPQKIEPAYRPKPVQRRGKSFVQIHRPMTLMPRSQTADYVLRTRSVTSNSTDEDSPEEYESRCLEQRLDRDMNNLRIVGKSLQQPAKLKGRTGGGGKVPPIFTGAQGGGGGSSSKYFPSLNQDVQTQMQTISPPYSCQTSSYLSTTSSRAATSAAMEDLCVVNHVNPSPRHTAHHHHHHYVHSNHHVSVYDVTNGTTSEADVTGNVSEKSSEVPEQRSLLLSGVDVSGVISAVILENATLDDDEEGEEEEDGCELLGGPGDPLTPAGELLAPPGEQSDSGVGLDDGTADCVDGEAPPTPGAQGEYDNDDSDDQYVGVDDVGEDLEEREGEGEGEEGGSGGNTEARADTST